ncbi:MAG: hypothetical protein HY543_09810 [Deltaproteobacteria bacterium]|nr:hypothetical protein [Deltaproteobacteria bacterium]
MDDIIFHGIYIQLYCPEGSMLFRVKRHFLFLVFGVVFLLVVPVPHVSAQKSGSEILTGDEGVVGGALLLVKPF